MTSPQVIENINQYDELIDIKKTHKSSIMPASAQSDDLAQWLRFWDTRAKFDIRFEQLYTFPKEKDSLPFTNSDHQDYHSLLVQDGGLHIYFPGSLFFSIDIISLGEFDGSTKSG